MASSETRPVSPLREARGDLRQADVAERAGVSVSYISMIEAGLVPPPPVRQRIAEAVERPIRVLWPGFDK
jgi:transcriptional regulator with XRE-family HTH domain